MATLNRPVFADFSKLDKLEAAAKLSKTGGEHRAKNLSSKRKSDIASTAAKARWAKQAYA